MPKFDLNAALDNVGGDVSLLKEIICAFVEEYPGLLARIQDGLASGDATAVKRSAHTLKGEVGTLGPTEAFDLAKQLERMGHDKNLSDAEETLRQLKAALEELRPTLESVG